MKKTVVVVIAFSLALSWGCDRYLDSKDPVQSLPSGEPTPTGLQVKVNNQTVTLGWTVADSSNVQRYRVYSADSANGQFTLLDSSNVTEKVLSGLQVNRIYYFKVAAVLNSGLEGNRSVAVSARVSLVSINIANGNKFTSNRNVTVQINTTNQPTSVILSEDPTFADAVYVAFSTQQSFRLSTNDGLKTVYARLIFTDGSETGDLLSDQITLDTRAVIESVFFSPVGLTFAPGDNITFGLDAGETEGVAFVEFSGVSRINLFDDGFDVDNLAGDGVYHGSFMVPENLDLFNGTVNGHFSDAAGNTANIGTSYINLNINTPPESVQLFGYLSADDDSVYFNWTQSTANDFVLYRLYQDNASSTVDVNDILVQHFGEQSTTSVGIVSRVGTTYYRLFVVDQHGAVAGSNVVQIVN